MAEGTRRKSGRKEVRQMHVWSPGSDPPRSYTP